MTRIGLWQPPFTEMIGWTLCAGPPRRSIESWVAGAIGKFIASLCGGGVGWACKAYRGSEYIAVSVRWTGLTRDIDGKYIGKPER